MNGSNEVTTMPLTIIRNDITLVRADAIVNPANPQPIYADGTDRAVYMAAGAEKLLAARRKIGPIAPGQAAATRGFRLPARYIIHAVGPVWAGGGEGELEILRACYDNALAKAAELRCRSIAFPLLASGVNGFPRENAMQIALSAINRFLMTHEMDVTLVVFSREAFELSGKVFSDVQSLIDDLQVREAMRAEYTGGRNIQQAFRCAPSVVRNPKAAPRMEAKESFAMPAPCAYRAEDDGTALDELLRHKPETFQQRLLHLIDQSGMSDVEVYKRANIDRKHFSKIRSDKDYRPSKKTAVAFAVALRLDMAQTEDLLARAGWALSDAQAFDVIVKYFIRERQYDLSEINFMLCKYEQEQLGA